MTALRSYVAVFLLLCFVRVQLPEAWILALHRHGHTTEEPAHAPAFVHKGKALFSVKHQHCPVEQFYDGAFQLAAPVVVPRPLAVSVYASPELPRAAQAAAWRATGPASLRGPPAQA